MCTQTHINLDANQIRAASALSGLKNPESLGPSLNEIVDLSPVEFVPNLRKD